MRKMSNENVSGTDAVLEEEDIWRPTVKGGHGHAKFILQFRSRNQVGQRFGIGTANLAGAVTINSSPEQGRIDFEIDSQMTFQNVFAVLGREST